MPSLLSARPRLEPSVNRTGAVPHYAPPHPEARRSRLEGPHPHPEARQSRLEGHPESVDAPPPTDAQLAALYRQLSIFRSECHAAYRERERCVCVVPRGDIEWLNHELDGIRRLNAALPRQQRAQSVAHWPHPVLRPGALHSVRDVLPALDLALRILIATGARRGLELGDD